jgi:glycosyltransferase involved in cell wall biosynthesis
LDPSGDYRDDSILENHNITYFGYPVDFISLVKQCDAYIRPTNTDGDSVAIRESLMSGVPVLASDAVSRDSLVRTFRTGDVPDFVEKINTLSFDRIKNANIDSINKYIQFLEGLIFTKNR